MPGTLEPGDRGVAEAAADWIAGNDGSTVDSGGSATEVAASTAGTPIKSEREILESILRVIGVRILERSLEELESQVRTIRRRRIRNYKYATELLELASPPGWKGWKSGPGSTPEKKEQ
jgi:hypothetical protein